MSGPVHGMVADAVRDGRLIRRPCEECGNERAVAHHDDYAKPLDVRWLCHSHHRLWHARNVAKNKVDAGTMPINFRVDPVAHAELELLAKRDDRSVSYLLRRAVRDYLTTRETSA